jgi:(2Fe-2S) ferredoxin
MGKNYLKLSEFNLEGEFLGFVDRSHKKFKYLQLSLLKSNTIASSAVGNLEIKLPKELRKALGLSLVPGVPIRVTGLSKFSPRKNAIKLKAYEVMPLAVCPITETPVSLVETVPAKCLPKARIMVCQKSGCWKRGGKHLLSKIEKTLGDRGLHEHVKITTTGCMKRCSKAPNCVVQMGRKKYTQIKPDAIASLLEDHLS